MKNKITNIILVLVIIVLLLLDALAIHDIIIGEPDILYESATIIVSIFVFIAIGVYIKQRKRKSSQSF